MNQVLSILSSFSPSLKIWVLCSLCFFISGCFTIPQDPSYKGPVARPPAVEEYYKIDKSYSSFSEVLVGEKEKFRIKRITIQSGYSPVVIDYFQRYEHNENLVLVFPVLGGKNIISEYFARYFARRGFDTAIVNRNNDFKKPDNFDRIEEIFRQDVVRDRIALDFFEKEYGKKHFGSFGISRGAINVAMTAGVDSRLEYNVMALGGTDLVKLFQSTNQSRINKYRNAVLEQKGIDEDQFTEFLLKTIKTDPKYLARYIDARKSLMILGVFDKTVPFSQGQQLRADIGTPRTVYIMADHYVALLYTQFLKFIPPTREFTVLPLDYLETQALNFYLRNIPGEHKTRKAWWLAMLQAPFNLVGTVVHALTITSPEPNPVASVFEDKKP